MQWSIRRLPTRIQGLRYRPSITRTAWCWPPEDLDDCARPPDLGNPVDNPGLEFSACNQTVLASLIDETVQCILEIGVAKGGDRLFDTYGYPVSSTRVLLENKQDHAVYLGIDIQDKSFLHEKAPNVFTLRCDSRDSRRVIARLHELGHRQIDLLMIDGYHSLRQVLSDWAAYIPHLAAGGAVVLHDTNCHPGPSLVFEAIDERCFDKCRHCTADDDWGIAVVRRR